MIRTDQLQSLLNAPGIEALWDQHARQMVDYGFDA